MAKITSYQNNKGELVKIAEMPDAYLLNAYTYYKKRMEKAAGDPFTYGYYVECKERVDALHEEIKKRKLI